MRRGLALGLGALGLGAGSCLNLKPVPRPSCAIEEGCSLDDADQALTGSADDDLVGWSVSVGGDLSGDGEADLVVGAPGCTTVEDPRETGTFLATCGAADPVVYVVQQPLSATAALGRAAARVRGDGEAVGMALDGRNDLDGDGNADLVIGAEPDCGGCYQSGAAAVFYGPLEGILFTGRDEDARLERLVDGDTWGDSRLAEALDAGGDADGDGQADLLIGDALMRDSANENAWMSNAWLALGPLEGERLHGEGVVFTNYAEISLVGLAVTLDGDLDGDGFADVIVGAPGRSDGAGDGQVLVFRAPFQEEVIALDDAIASVEGVSAALGTALSVPGDVDGDGRDDLLIGGFGWGEHAGAAWLVLAPLEGSLSTDEAEARLEGEAVSAGEWGLAGQRVSGGDMDGDGHADLLVAAPLLDRTYLVNGPVSGTRRLSRADATFSGPAGSWAGMGLGAGDLDEDGLDEVVIGAPALSAADQHGVYLFSGYRF